MPSAKILEGKKAVVAELSEKIKAASAGVVVSYQGITVENDTELRNALRKAGVEYKVYKNSITGRACEDAGYGDIKEYLTGMTALAITKDDEVAPAKVLKEYADKIESFSIKGGFIDGKVIGADEVRALADVPSKPILVGKLLGTMVSPVQKLASVLQQIIDKGEEAPAEAAAETAEPAEE